MSVTYQASRQFPADIAKPDKSDFHHCTQFFSKSVTRRLKKLERRRCLATIEKFGRLGELFCYSCAYGSVAGCFSIRRNQALQTMPRPAVSAQGRTQVYGQQARRG